VKCAVEMDSGVMMYIPRIINTCSGIQKLIGVNTHIETYRHIHRHAESKVISKPTLFIQNKEESKLNKFIYNIRQDNIMYGKNPVDGMSNDREMAKNHMGMQANRMMGRGRGKHMKLKETNIVRFNQYGWRVSVCCTERMTELQVCIIANLSLELNCPNTDTACIINTFLQIGNVAHRSKILLLSLAIIQYLKIHILVTLCWADHMVKGSC
jgi:hypothetical protein